MRIRSDNPSRPILSDPLCKQESRDEEPIGPASQPSERPRANAVSRRAQEQVCHDVPDPSCFTHSCCFVSVFGFHGRGDWTITRLYQDRVVLKLVSVQLQDAIARIGAQRPARTPYRGGSSCCCCTTSGSRWSGPEKRRRGSHRITQQSLGRGQPLPAPAFDLGHDKWMPPLMRAVLFRPASVHCGRGSVPRCTSHK